MAPAVIVVIIIAVVAVVGGAILFTRGGGTSSGTGSTSGIISLTLTASKTMTPNSDYRTGVFDRIFYNASRNKFYLTMACLGAGSEDNSFSNQYYVYYELDSDLNQTGVSGLIPVTQQGDYAIASDGTYYYFLTGHPQGWRLFKLDSDFQVVDNVVVPFSIDNEAGNDELLNYTNGKLYMATLYDTQGTGQNYYTGTHNYTTYPHLFTYNTSLQLLENHYLLDESNIPAGGSIIFNDNKYQIVTANTMGNSTLSVYQWDSNWNYLGKTTLVSGGNWSQGLLYENGLYYLAYHIGQHNNGGVVLAVYDNDWNKITSADVAERGGATNSDRPWIIKVGDKIYVSYDVATASSGGVESRDWQCHIDVYTVSEQ